MLTLLRKRIQVILLHWLTFQYICKIVNTHSCRHGMYKIVNKGCHLFQCKIVGIEYKVKFAKSLDVLLHLSSRAADSYSMITSHYFQPVSKEPIFQCDSSTDTIFEDNNRYQLLDEKMRSVVLMLYHQRTKMRSFIAQEENILWIVMFFGNNNTQYLWYRQLSKVESQGMYY